MIALMCLSALNLICTIIVLRFYYHDPTPPPAWLRRLIGSSQVEDDEDDKVRPFDSNMAATEHKAQWEKVAKLVDNICFGLFLIIIIAMTVAVIGII